MRVKTCAFLLISFLAFSCQSEGPHYLVRISGGALDETGAPSGYVNEKGDTIVPLGKYQECFTDTLKHFAVVLTHDNLCLAIDQTGKELYEIYWYDNGPDYISEGLFRIKENGKTGYANEEGKVIIPPQYKCAEPFENGKARVAFDCELTPDGEYTLAQSNSWFFIDKQGNKTKE